MIALQAALSPGARVETSFPAPLALALALASIVMGFVYYLELVVWFYAVRRIDVSLASAITTPWPALTLALAALALRDPIEARQVVSLIVVATCIYGLTLAGMRKQPMS